MIPTETVTVTAHPPVKCIKCRLPLYRAVDPRTGTALGYAERRWLPHARGETYVLHTTGLCRIEATLAARLKG